jgi:malate permease and related proteins
LGQTGDAVQLFLEILTDITLPILGLVALGFGVQKYFTFDVSTLTRMQIYVLLPGALIYFPSAAKLPLETALPILWFSLLHFAFLFALSWSIAKALSMDGNVVRLVAIVALFSNSGNYGIPLIQFTFPDDYRLYQTVILSLHSILITPVALIAFEHEGEDRPSPWVAVLISPILLAAMLGYLLKGLDLTLPLVISLPLKLLSEAFTPMALLLLGVQLATIGTEIERKPLAVGLALRLLLAPASAWLFAYLFGFSPELIAFFVVSASAPAGVLVAIFANEYNTRPELASMMVFISTIVSALTVTSWVYAVRYAGLH